MQRMEQVPQVMAADGPTCPTSTSFNMALFFNVLPNRKQGGRDESLGSVPAACLARARHIDRHGIPLGVFCFHGVKAARPSVKARPPPLTDAPYHKPCPVGCLERRAGASVKESRGGRTVEQMAALRADCH